VLKLTGTTAILYWEMMGTDYWINDGTNPYPSFHVTRQLGEQIPSGSVIVDTSNHTEIFFSVAVQAPDHFSIFMVNTGEESFAVTVEGLPEGHYTHFQTTETALETTSGTYAVPTEMLTIQIPAMSSHMLSSHNPSK